MKDNWCMLPVAEDRRPEAAALLAACALPLVGLEKTRLFGLFASGQLVGVIGYEDHRPYALLRSLAVRKEHRGHGWGTALVQFALAAVREEGFESAFALTVSAHGLLRAAGFAPLGLVELPLAVRRSPELAHACGAQASAYVRPLKPQPATGQQRPLALRTHVREAYGLAVRTGSPCCGSEDPGRLARELGYRQEELEQLPEGANLGLSCGNPLEAASLKEGEWVLDLGSGAGFDCFLAAPKVGPSGRVIGVDMTPEMVNRSRAMSIGRGFANVEFRLGEIEHLPVADASVDVVISNCVVNLSLDKEQVVREVFRVLKPGGRVAIADTVVTGTLPAEVAASVEAYTSCISGALAAETYRALLEKAGFTEVSVQLQALHTCCGPGSLPLASALVTARKPAEVLSGASR